MSRRAVVVILVALALFMVALTVRSGWLYLVTGGLISVVLASGISSVISLRSISISRRSPARVFEGDPFTVSLRVTNKGILGRYLMEITDMQFAGPGIRQRLGELLVRPLRGGGGEYRDRGSGAGRTPNIMFRAIPRGSSLEAEYDMVAPVRGVHTDVTYAISGGDPFGLLRIRRKKTVEASMVVYPGISWLEYFPIVPEGISHTEEAFEMARKGPGRDYLGVREYRYGDSLRHIHWRSTAKSGTLIVKEFQKEVRPATGILVQLSSPLGGTPHENSMEDGLRAAASIINYCYGMGSPPLVVVPTDRGWEGLDSPTLWSALELLAAYRPLPEVLEDIQSGLDRARGMLSSRSTMVVVSNGELREIAGDLALGHEDIDCKLVWVKGDSYRGSGSKPRGVTSLGSELEAAGWKAMDTYVVEAHKDIGSCLKESLSITAG